MGTDVPECRTVTLPVEMWDLVLASFDAALWACELHEQAALLETRDAISEQVEPAPVAQ